MSTTLTSTRGSWRSAPDARLRWACRLAEQAALDQDELLTQVTLEADEEEACIDQAVLGVDAVWLSPFMTSPQKESRCVHWFEPA